MNPMKNIKIGKAVLNIGVGHGGRELSEAENVLEELANQEPVRTFAKQTNQTWGVREGSPVGCKVTVRKQPAVDLLKKLLEVRGNEIKESSFDDSGNFSFGIDEHIEIPKMEYDPDVGIFGLDVSVDLVRPGFRVAKRRREPKKIPSSHRIDKEEAIEFVEENLEVRVVNA
ncbi:MAG: 50S ribosomal protein L5 [Candidatus Hadarchaeota archaeon]